jgi:sugar-specific transcriptional regulator TrmB
MKDYKDHGLNRQAVAAAELIRALGEDAEDETLIHDAVEGETDFFEAVERALDEISECEIIAAGIKDMQKRLQDRLTRTQNRQEKLRGLIDQAFQMAEIKSHKFATATIASKQIPRKLIVTDESQLPARFFKPQPPKLDRKELTDALKDGEAVPGADLSNGGTTIQIRRA